VIAPDLAPVPSHVRVEAQRAPAPIPLSTLNSRQAEALILDIRRSELRKHRALRDAVQHADAIRANTKQKKSTAR
jgi:hypothetical protein